MKPIIIKYKKEHTIRERMLLFLLGEVIPVHAKLYFKREPWYMLREDMVKYPKGTLGNELGHFLKTEELQPVPKVERHDAYHILLDFTTHIDDEAAMQFFLIGNGKISPFTLGTAAFAGLMMPDHWKNFWVQLKRGRKAKSIAKWNFKELLNEDYEELKNIIFHRPVTNKALLAKVNSFG